MTRPLKPSNEFYNELEAASYLNISIFELHALLDQYIFTNGHTRPADLSFSDADLVLLGFWSNRKEGTKVIRMPRRD